MIPLNHPFDKLKDHKHEKGIFKYGVNNQDCLVHFGRYCIEQHQNIVTTWQMMMYRLLLKLEAERHILMKFGKNGFSEEEIKIIVVIAMGKQPQSIHHARRDAGTQQIVECEVAVFDHVVQQSGNDF